MRGVGVPGGNTVPSGVKMWEEEMRKLELCGPEREAVMESMLAREVRYYGDWKTTIGCLRTLSRLNKNSPMRRDERDELRFPKPFE